MPTNAASTSPLRSLAGPDSKIWRWEASCPRNANWVKITPRVPASSSCSQESSEQDHPGATGGQRKQQNQEDHQIEAGAATLQSAPTSSLR
jgi:hypothetical protein